MGTFSRILRAAMLCAALAPTAHAMEFNVVGETLILSGPVVSADLIRLRDRKYPPDLLERTVYPRHAEDIVYAFHPSRYPADASGRGVVECLKQADVSFQCTMLQGLDALGIGVITNPEILVLDPETKAVLARLEGPKP